MGTGDNTVYNFCFFNVGNERSMSGWTKWVFNYDVAHMGFFQDRCYVILYNPATKAFILSTIDPLDNPGDCTISAAGREFTPRLDVLIPKSSCTLEDINDRETLVTIPSFLAVRNKDSTPKKITTVFGDLGNATYFQKYPLIVGSASSNPPPTPGPCVPDDCAAPNPDACDGVTCPPGEVCDGGFCFPDVGPGPGPGPGPDTCEGVECPPGEECFAGFCIPIDPCEGIGCPDGQFCLDGVCVTPDDPCNFVDCQPGYTCVDGVCVEDEPIIDLCEGVGCPPGETCVDGICLPTPDPERIEYDITPQLYCTKGTSPMYISVFANQFNGSISNIKELISITFIGYADDLYPDLPSDPCDWEVYRFVYIDQITNEERYATEYFGSATCIDTDGSPYPAGGTYTWVQGFSDGGATCELPAGFDAPIHTDPLLRTTSDTVNTPNSFIISKEDSALDFSVGYDYPMRVELPSFYLIGNKEADRNDVPIVENVKVYLYLSGSYQAKLSRLGYEDKFIDLEVARADIYKADSNPIAEVGEADIPLFCKGDLAIVEISSDSPLPAALTGYGWEGHFSARGVKPIKR